MKTNVGTVAGRRLAEERMLAHLAKEGSEYGDEFHVTTLAQQRGFSQLLLGRRGVLEAVLVMRNRYIFGIPKDVEKLVLLAVRSRLKYQLNAPMPPVSMVRSAFVDFNTAIGQADRPFYVAQGTRKIEEYFQAVEEYNRQQGARLYTSKKTFKSKM